MEKREKRPVYSTFFAETAREYREKFWFMPYYNVLYTLLGGACLSVFDDDPVVLEIGAAAGIIPSLLSDMRRGMYGDHEGKLWNDPLLYYSVDPSSVMVKDARDQAQRFCFRYEPFVGSLKDIVAKDVSWMTEGAGRSTVDILVISRALHEIWASYGYDTDRLIDDLLSLLEIVQPDKVIIGDALCFTGLTNEETERFRLAQTAIMGHGHDPSTEYFSSNQVEDLFYRSDYTPTSLKELVYPLEGFGQKNPWRFFVTTFEYSPASRSPNLYRAGKRCWEP